jgi:hypothetical protein
MGNVLVLKQNSPEIRGCIENAGITVCACASFEGARWLNFHPYLEMYREVHGIGYGDETMDGDTDIAMFLHDHPDAYYCKDVDEFINKIKEYKTK